MKHIAVILLAAALCLPLASCKSKPEEESKTIGENAVTYNISASFPQDGTAAKQTLAGALAGAKEQNKSVKLSPSYGGGADETRALAGISPDNSDGLIAMPSTAELSILELSRVASRGVPTAVINTSLSQNDFAVTATYTSEYNLGVAAGKAAKAYIEETLAGKADIIIVEHTPKSHSGNTALLNGFLDQIKDMKEARPTRDLKCADAEEMTKQLDSYFESAGDKPAPVIFCTNPDGIIAADAAAAKAKLGGKTAIFGAGLDENVAKLLKSEGTSLRGVAATDYWQMGYKAMQAILAAAESEASEIGALAITDPIVLKPSDDDSKKYLAKAFS